MGMREMARQHRRSRNLIRLWMDKYEAGQLTDEVANSARIAEYEAKIAALERRVG
jgi:transposase